MILDKPLRGIIVPMITPLKKNNELDAEGLERLVEHVIAGGVHGIFILGTTGEGVGLSYDIRQDIVKRVCSQVQKRLPVLVGITDTSVTESIRMAEVAAENEADAVVSAPPYYFTPDQSELLSFYNCLIEQLPLPLFLYNMPSHTQVFFETDTVIALSRHSKVIGLKDSSANLVYFQKVVYAMRDQPEFSLLVGPEEGLMPSILTGAHGGVNGVANMFPRIYVEMYNAAVNRDFDRMTTVQKKILHISSSLYNVGNSGSSYLKGIKSALSCMGICSDYPAEPLYPFNKNERAQIAHRLNELNEVYHLNL